MNRILELEQKLGETVDKASVWVVKATEGKRGMNSEERESYNRAMTEAIDLRETIKIEKAHLEITGGLQENRARRAAETGTDVDVVRGSFKKWMQFGPDRLNQDEKRSLSTIPSWELRGNPQSDVTGNLGQYTVPQDFYAEVQTALKYFSGMMESGAFMVNTGEGRDLPVPTSNDTATMGIELSENTQVATPTEVPFGQVTMKAFKYTTKLILIPEELMQDSAVDIEAYIVKMLATRLGRILNLRFTTGNGTGQPRGITLDAVLGRTSTTGKVFLPQYNDILALKYSVDRLYRQRGKWMMSDTTWLGMLELVDNNGRPLILNYLNVLANDTEGHSLTQEQLLGQAVIINNDMASPGTNGSPVVGNVDILYGDFSNYWIRTVKELIMKRLIERYADFDQVGLIGFARYDGRLIDAGTNPVKYMQSPTT